MYRTLIILVLLTSCVKADKKNEIEELVLLGYSGLCKMDSSKFPFDKLAFDSTRLDIREYFEYKKDSFIRIANRKHYLLPLEYHTINPVDTIGFGSLIDKTLTNKSYEMSYFSKEVGFYNGLHYLLFYKTSDQKEHTINYEPYYLPDSLKILQKFIDKIVLSIYNKTTNKFEFNGITRKEALKIYRQIPVIIEDTIGDLDFSKKP